MYVLKTMTKPKSNRSIFLLAALLLIAALLIFYFGFPAKNKKIGIVSPDLDDLTKVCSLAIPTEELNPLTGVYKSDKNTGYIEYFYLANLKSLGSKYINGCNFAIIELETNFKLFTKLYIPVGMPSLGTKLNTLPAEMGNYLGKKVEIVVRYGLNSEKEISSILGWQFVASYDN